MKSSQPFTAAALVVALLMSFPFTCSDGAARADFVPDEKLEAGGASLPLDQALVLFAAGDVDARAAEDAAWRPVQAGDYLPAGQTLKTGPDSACELQLGDRAMARLEENTSIRLDELFLKSGEARIGLNAGLGTVLCKVEKLSGAERFRVRTRTAVCGVRGTEFGVTVSDTEGTRLEVKTGRVGFLPAAFDPEELKAETAGGPPELTETLEGLKEAEQVVGREESAVITEADAKKMEVSAAELRWETRRLKANKTLSKEERAVFKNRVNRARDMVKREMKPTRRLGPEQLKRLKPLENLRLRRIPLGPRKMEADDGVRPTVEDQPPERSERLVRIQIRVTPRQAGIFQDDRFVGRGRFQGLFPEGERLQFRFDAPQHKPQERTIEVGAGRPKIFEITLEKESDRDAEREPRSSDLPPRPPRDAGPEGAEAENRTKPFRVAVIAKPSGSPFVGEPVVSGERIFLVDREGTVFGVNRDGRGLIRAGSDETPNPYAGLFQAGGKVYYAGRRKILVIDAGSGRVLERLGVEPMPAADWNRLAVVGPNAFALPGDGRLRVFETEGRQLADVPFPPRIAMCLAVHKGFIFMCDLDGAVHTLLIGEGRFPFPPFPGPVRKPDARAMHRGAPPRLYFAGANGTLACLDPEGRRLIWEKSFPAGRDPVSLAVNDAGVFLFASGSLFGFSHDGDEIFPRKPGYAVPPLAIPGRIVAVRGDGAVEILDAGTGALLREGRSEHPISTRPVMLGRLIAAGTRTGQVVVIDPAGEPPEENRPPR